MTTCNVCNSKLDIFGDCDNCTRVANFKNEKQNLSEAAKSWVSKSCWELNDHGIDCLEADLEEGSLNGANSYNQAKMFIAILRKEYPAVKIIDCNHSKLIKKLGNKKEITLSKNNTTIIPVDHKMVEFFCKGNLKQTPEGELIALLKDLREKADIINIRSNGTTVDLITASRIKKIKPNYSDGGSWYHCD